MICSLIEVPYFHEVIRYFSLTTLVVICNSVVLYIWMKPSNRSAITVCLSILAVSDMLSMMSGTTNTMTEYFSTTWNYISMCFVHILSKTFSDLFHSCSILITTSTAIQRFVVCAFPPSFCNSRARTILLSTSFVLSMIFTSPYLHELFGLKILVFSSYNFTKIYNYAETQNNASSEEYKIHNYLGFNLKSSLTETTVVNNSITVVSDCLEYNSSTSMKREVTAACISQNTMTTEVMQISSLCYLIFLHILPTVIIIFCTSYCLYKIRWKTIENVSSRSDSAFMCKRRNTLLLAVVMLSVLLGEIPTTISVILKITYGRSRNDVWLISSDGLTFCELSTAMSYLRNVIIYTAMSKQFRRTFFAMFSCRKKT